MAPKEAAPPFSPPHTDTQPTAAQLLSNPQPSKDHKDKTPKALATSTRCISEDSWLDAQSPQEPSETQRDPPLRD
ncbi:hypothetical protein FQN60_017484 [Etheostoma spectabile]|uniref:Uncharacterized protein n=1 Tax=Etheostoma spectabile TaxID=54343 RepID=A0A5J5CCQ7_9PERO|nr:hypothetical protein FQN60_017484 [Etheostoma spectabile]